MKKKFNLIIILFLMFNFVFLFDVHAIDKSNIIGFGGNDYEKFYDIIEINSNEYIAVGAYGSSDIKINDKLLKNSGRYDAIILKYKNKNIQWYNTVSTPGEDVFSSIIKVEDGYVVVGHTNAVSENGYSIIVKYDLNGNKVWEKINDSYSEFNSVLYNNNSFVCAGSTRDSDGNIIPYIVKYDLDGKVVSEYKTNFEDYIDYKIFKLLYSGERYYAIFSDEIYNSYFILDNNFNIIELKDFNLENQNPIITNAIITSKGTFIIVGQNGYISTISGSTVSDYGFIAEYDKNGNLTGMGQKVIKTHKQNYIFDIVEVDDGYRFIGAYSDIDLKDLTATNVTQPKTHYLGKIDKSYNISVLDNSIGKAVVNSSEDVFIENSLNNEVIIYGSSKPDGVYEHSASNKIDSFIIKKFYDETNNNGNSNNNGAQKVKVGDTASNLSLIEISIGILFVITGGICIYKYVLNNNKKFD